MRTLLGCLLLSLFTLCSFGAETGSERNLTKRVEGLRKIDGLLPLYWSEEDGKLWLEISHFDQDLLYIASLPAGVGSNDIGLDRGLISASKLVRFEKIGPQVLLVERNTRFRASSSNPMEQRAVQDSFAESVLWGFEVAAQEGNRVLVDATRFFQSDFAGVARTIKAAHQGSYTLDASRSAVYLGQTKGFPRNTEVEATLTFAGDDAGSYVKDVVPSPESITVREHHSFVQLPDTGFEERAFDPRAGYFDLTYRDYSAPLGSDPDQRLITRHRLQKANAGEAVSRPVKPIVYYIDGGAPTDVRNALADGASWWQQAFEAAGFADAFQIKILPADIDPMDIRYNVVQWVHRFTRGWSYGNAIVDPRTGEILKGQVTLGSLRYRQDYLIFSGLLSPFGPGDNTGMTTLRNAVYARLRQLAAHEIGHTLGLAHNFVASTENNASVMDYPHAFASLHDDGSVDLTKAYPTGIGTWDKVAIRYGYTQFAPGTDTKAELSRILAEAARSGNTFITDADSRPLGSAHPKAHLWDNGPDPVAELTRLLNVRRAALDRFGENSIPTGEVFSRLEETLVPLYFLHRYQTEAAAKVLGGVDYTYAVRGDGQTITRIVPAPDQRRALAALLQTVSPSVLTTPERIVALIPPHPPGYDRTRESFPSQTGVTFDPIAAAQAAAGLTGSLLFNPQRAARLIENHSRNAANPSLQEVIGAVAKATWLAPAQPGLAAEVKRGTDVSLLKSLLALAVSAEDTSPLVSQVSLAWLTSHRTQLPLYGQRLLADFERNPKGFELPPSPAAPPGQPIGEMDSCALPPLP